MDLDFYGETVMEAGSEINEWREAGRRYNGRAPSSENNQILIHITHTRGFVHF